MDSCIFDVRDFASNVKRTSHVGSTYIKIFRETFKTVKAV